MKKIIVEKKLEVKMSKQVNSLILGHDFFSYRGKFDKEGKNIIS